MPMLQNPIALKTLSLSQPIKKALHTAARLEYDGVQIDTRREVHPSELSETGLRQFRKMLDDLNLRVGSVAFPTRRGYADADDLQRRMDAAIASMRLASELSARTMVFTLGSIPESEDSSYTTLLDVLGTLGVHGNRLGVSLAAHAPEAEIEQLTALLEALPAGTLGLDLNPAALIARGDSPSAFLKSVGQHVCHVFANDAVRGFGETSSTSVELGRGSADLPALLGAMEEHNYRGWITVERSGSENLIEDCTNAVKFLRSL
ncbi:sugar phosphate isomerase/epimerase family protein [Adhaeretor mobilis]|uniref:Xylose isomerase-like TIM barrel n=1 Tax=Adhaeretor mobilis TaxID=1930276 RepID=A0A517MS84_9BACT|nr:sugar phosphate isomerase/epimerase family protein [Adhaeretor mobilis]QDS97741.1 Xylose isomerase-like TIM barrel [Adhaeretor mobilis]